MSRRLGTQSEGCPQVHRRDPSKNPRACGPCGQPSYLTTNTVASTRLPPGVACAYAEGYAAFFMPSPGSTTFGNSSL